MIEIYEATKPREISRFRRKQIKYFKKDLFTNHMDEDYLYFVGSEYWQDVLKIHELSRNRIQFLFFKEKDKEIGFCQYRLNDSKDYSGLIMEFCVYKRYRGNGKGHECANALMSWAKERKARYFEINADDERRRRFWASLGYYENGVDSFNNPLMINTQDGIVKFLNANEESKYEKLLRVVASEFPGLESEKDITEHMALVDKFTRKYQALCYMDKGEILGVLLLSRSENTICFLAVNPTDRGKGIGGKILGVAINYLDRNKDIVVSTYRDGDPKGVVSRKLYEKFGFVPSELTEEFGYPIQVFRLR